MKFKFLGSSNLRIPAVGQGCWGVGGYFTRDISQDDFFINSLQYGIQQGLTFLDTAENYAEGHSEELIGRAITGIRSEVVLASKVAPEHLAYDDVLRSAEQSLKRLGTDYLDLYQIHWPNPRIPLKETMLAMERLLQEKLVRHIGVSNFSLRNLKKSQALLSQSRIESIQQEYNFFDRTAEEDILPYCSEKQITLIAYSPLERGKPLGGWRTNTLSALAKKYGCTENQLKLSWLIEHTPVIVIPKAVNPKHIEENGRAANISIEEADYEELARIFSRPVLWISPEKILVDAEGIGAFVPSASDLAVAIREEEYLKPIRVIPGPNPETGFEYNLVEGKLRYWAWVEAFGFSKPIPALIKGE